MAVYYNLPSGVIARASFPSSANAGYIISVNADQYNNYSNSQKTLVTTHEFGHCIGFRHTDWQGNETQSPYGANLVPNTPSTDNNSVMNRAIGGNDWNGFSIYDQIASKTVYPWFFSPNFTSESIWVLAWAELRWDRAWTGVTVDIDRSINGGPWVREASDIDNGGTYVGEVVNLNRGDTVSYRIRRIGYRGEISWWSDPITFTNDW